MYVFYNSIQMFCAGKQSLFVFNQYNNYYNLSYWAIWCLFTQRHSAQEKNNPCLLKPYT